MTETTDNIGEILAAKPLVLTRGARILAPRERHDDPAGRWSPPAAWTAIALVVGSHLPAWAWMWLIAIAVFAACKWATWWPYRFGGTAARRAGFLFAYPGMDAESFFLGPPVRAPHTSEWLTSAARAIAGAALIWLVARFFFPAHPLAAGWTAMIGLVLLLHFGLLDLLSLAWQKIGVNAPPLMRTPSRAKSLADLWGRRWNTGFRTLAHDYLFGPLRRTAGVTAATAAVFAASGAIHDLVISAPARGGYGLPTLYFLIQFTGLLIERTRTMRRTFARHAALGRVYTAIFTLAPLPLLFHEKFVNNVVLPFLTAIGGLS
ncbi:MAG: hypothetical protein QOF78_2993 [Phycisphaerales bacterium]|jgi:alginate O-acetyltransferase complex protein AlgI|nr:hypothetical protein [Phycisphaerales bacterium]